MMRRSLFFALLISLFACSKNKAQPNQNDRQVEGATLRYLALGDSYTIGTAIGSEKAYPQIFADSLGLSDNVDSLKVQVIAQNGWTTRDLQNGINRSLPAANFNLVSLLIGVNNQYQQRSLEEYKIEFRQLLSQAIAFADGDTTRLVVISIPDWGVSPAGAGSRTEIAEQIDAFNAAQKSIASEAGVVFVDITSLSRTALNDSSLIAADGLHFSAKMQQQWLQLLYPIFAERINP